MSVIQKSPEKEVDIVSRFSPNRSDKGPKSLRNHKRIKTPISQPRIEGQVDWRMSSPHNLGMNMKRRDWIARTLPVANLEARVNPRIVVPDISEFFRAQLIIKEMIKDWLVGNIPPVLP